MNKNITVGYQGLEKEVFMSNKVNTNNFLAILSNFIKVISIPATLEKISLSQIKRLNINYLLTDIKNFGPMQFILREKEEVDIPFIIMLHTVYDWFRELVYVVPLIRKEDIIIAPSEYARRSILKIAGNLKVHVVPNCLDIIEVQKNALYQTKRHNKLLGYMGRLDKDRGIETLIDCMPEIISKVNDVHLNIIGPLSGHLITNRPESPYVEQLINKVRRLKLTGNIHFLGIKSGKEKYKILSELDIFVSSATQDNFSISLLESLACGVPVITTNCGGSRELIKDGYNGYLFSCNFNKNGNFEFDKKQLIFLVNKILKNKRLAYAMRRKASESALSYDFRKVAPRLIRLLKSKKNIKNYNKGKWGFLKNKKIFDFKNLYRKEILIFLDLFGIASTTYLNICKEIEDSFRKENLYNNVKFGEKNNNIHTEIIKDFSRRLFRYLCID